MMRRFVHHMKHQHWTAVCIDLVIVVLGVFIGLQVDNWNQARIERAALEQQLGSLRIEMLANLSTLKAWSQDEKRALEDLRFIRTSLTRGTDLDDAEAMDRKLMALAYVRQVNVDTSAYETLLNSGYLNRLAGTPLHKAILDWGTSRAQLEHVHGTALTIREMGTQALLGDLSFEAIFEHFTPARPWNAPPHFSNDYAALARNRKLASYLALKTAVEVQTLAYAVDLEKRTRDLVDLLAKRASN